MRVLDLFCGAGGAGMGLHYAWPDAEIVGVDISPQPRYPFTFIQADAMTYPLDGFDFIWASPPCQAFTVAQRIRDNSHPDLIAPTRERLKAAGIPYAIENVIGAPLLSPVMLCGASFDLKVYRHRIFETSFTVLEPSHAEHTAPLRKMGRPVLDGEFMHVVGNFSGANRAREAMGICWMTRDEIRESIPPAFSEYIALNFEANNAPI
jgi:DNA (cytosine-5)-methyltransferase 1